MAFLRLQHPHGTAKTVARLLDVPVRTAEKWIDRSSKPSFDHFGLALLVYGPPLLSALYPGLGWVEAAVRLTRREALQAQMAALDAEQSDLFDRMRRPRGRP